jgi:hypothetical protein
MPSRRTVYLLTRTRPDRSLSESRSTGKLISTVLPQANAYAMIRLRAAAAGVATKLGKHGFRAAGSSLPQKWRHAGKGRGDGEPHVDAHDAIYDRRRDEVSLDEVDRIVANPLSCPGSWTQSW